MSLSLLHFISLLLVLLLRLDLLVTTSHSVFMKTISIYLQTNLLTRLSA